MAGKKQSWVVEHEQDDEPTYVLDKANDPQGDHAVEFPVTISWEDRVAVANMVAAYLNNRTA